MPQAVWANAKAGDGDGNGVVAGQEGVNSIKPFVLFLEEPESE